MSTEDIWYDFFNRCLEICAKEVGYLLSEQVDEMIELPQAVVDEVFDRAIKFH